VHREEESLRREHATREEEQEEHATREEEQKYASGVRGAGGVLGRASFFLIMFLCFIIFSLFLICTYRLHHYGVEEEC
jgi:preprotein translocase subunit SecG